MGCNRYPKRNDLTLLDLPGRHASHHGVHAHLDVHLDVSVQYRSREQDKCWDSPPTAMDRRTTPERQWETIVKGQIEQFLATWTVTNIEPSIPEFERKL